MKDALKNAHMSPHTLSSARQLILRGGRGRVAAAGYACADGREAIGGRESGTAHLCCHGRSPLEVRG